MISRVSKDFAILENVDLAGYELILDFDVVLEAAPRVRQLRRTIGLSMSVQVSNQEQCFRVG